MFWLLDPLEQASIREKVSSLVNSLSTINGNLHDDQLFPFVGRKDKRKAREVINHLSEPGDLIVDSFSGSGTFPYAAAELNRNFKANEWEPYTHRMSNAPWRLPDKILLDVTVSQLKAIVQPRFNFLYKTICNCGHEHVLDSLFFDRVPLTYQNVTAHERLGPHGENVIFRGAYKCPNCGAKEKHFDQSDLDHLNEIAQLPLPALFSNLFFTTPLINNSRINLTLEFTTYAHLFPYRSILALSELWSAIQNIETGSSVKFFLEDCFLSILPQAKYKDYRSKSQDLHCPEKQLREVNLLNRLLDQIDIRFRRLSSYSFAITSTVADNSAITCADFREFISFFAPDSIGLFLTDPPWCDGNAYFEKAQLYHPWLSYSLSSDDQRLRNEFVVTDAPSRRAIHDLDRWWKDMSDFFELAYTTLQSEKFLALFFRPIPASKWLSNLNKIKLVARQAGFEPLLSIDVGSSDPSMRIQQSAAYVFSTDVVMLFLKQKPEHTRLFFNDVDIDQLAFNAAAQLQEELHGPFTLNEWRNNIATALNLYSAAPLNQPQYENSLRALLYRYADEISPGNFLTKPITPFSGYLFDVPAIERLFTFIPHIIDDLTSGDRIFSYDAFLLALATYVENGSRQLISQIESVDLKGLIEVYAEPLESGRFFRRRPLPQLPNGINDVLELDPYAFEAFTATLLSARGFTQVGLLGRSGDRGIDVIGRDPSGRLTVVQCKRYIQSNVSAEPIQRLHSFAITRGATRKIVITTSNFTPQAIEEAERADVELINGSQLAELIAIHLPDWPN